MHPENIYRWSEIQEQVNGYNMNADGAILDHAMDQNIVTEL